MSPGLPAPLDAITFDCWNTLIVEEDWASAHARRVDALERALRAAGYEPPRDRIERAFTLGWERHLALWHAGIASGAPEIARWALVDLDAELPGEILERLVREHEEASHSGRVVALEGARETLSQAVSAGLRCALVCDTGLTPGRVVRMHLERLGLLEHLAVQIFSDEAGVPKPDPKVFRLALAGLGARSECSVHVGDMRRTDVAGARAVAMGTVRLRASHDDTADLPEADAVADSHAHLREILAIG